MLKYFELQKLLFDRGKVKKFLIALPLVGLSFVYADEPQACFTPGGACTQLIVDTINSAQQNIDVQAYGFSSEPIINALVKAEAKGVKVRVILDKSNLSARSSGIEALKQAGIPMSIDYKVKIAHNKVMILDNQTLITGSFNFTSSAQTRNAENVLVIHNPQLAGQYEQNFMNRQAASLPYAECLTVSKCSGDRV